MSRHSSKLTLTTVITIGLAVLIVPVLVFILVFGHQRNSAAILNILQERMGQAQEDGIKTADGLTRPVAGTLTVVSEMVAADPTFFRTEEGRELLYRALISAEQVDGIPGQSHYPVE